MQRSPTFSFLHPSAIACLIALLLVCAPIVARAEKAGWYVGTGISANALRSVNDWVENAFDSERVTGWRLEAGYLWDLGRPGGFQLGVSGLYSNSGVFEGDVLGAESSVQALTPLLLIQQEIVSWVDFIAKVGLGAALYRYEDDAGLDLRSTEPAIVGALGFVFFPHPRLGLELLAEVTQFGYEYTGCDYYFCHTPEEPREPEDIEDCIGDWGAELCAESDDDYQDYMVFSLALSIQYRF